MMAREVMRGLIEDLKAQTCG
ncbi:MAG: hypothetical protein RIS44_1931, partial [Pseudomonadota bacterium]